MDIVEGSTTIDREHEEGAGIVLHVRIFHRLIFRAAANLG